MRRSALVLLSLLFCGSAHGETYDRDQRAAIQLVRDYYDFIFRSDFVNSEFRASEKFDYPDADYMAPGGDAESYWIVRKGFRIVKVASEKAEVGLENPRKVDAITITVRFRRIGFLDLFQDGFKKDPGWMDVTFSCVKSGGKYLIADLSERHVRFYDTAMAFLRTQIAKKDNLQSRWMGQMESLKKAAR